MNKLLFVFLLPITLSAQEVKQPKKGYVFTDQEMNTIYKAVGDATPTSTGRPLQESIEKQFAAQVPKVDTIRVDAKGTKEKK